MNPTVEEHRQKGPASLALAVVTVSDTRTIETDTSGALILTLAEEAGHRVVAREIVPDEPDRMRPLLLSYRDREDLHAVLMTGGTGISLVEWNFTNNGTINATTGTLDFASGTTTQNGAVTIGTGATVQFSNANTCVASSTTMRA